MFAADMTPYALFDWLPIDPFRLCRSVEYFLFDQSSCSTYQCTLSQHRKYFFLLRYATTLKFGLWCVARWMKSCWSLEKMELMLLSNGAKFLLPLIYLHAKRNRMYSQTRLPFTGGVYSTLQALIIRMQPQGQKVILSLFQIGTKSWAKDRDETGTKLQCTVLLTRLEHFQKMERDLYIILWAESQ